MTKSMRKARAPAELIYGIDRQSQVRATPGWDRAARERRQ